MTLVSRFFPTRSRAAQGLALSALALCLLVGVGATGPASAATTGSAPPLAAGTAQPARKYASSLPSAAPVRHVITTLAYDDLSRHIGERILITTAAFGDVRDVVIESYSRDEILVRARVTGGYATQHIARGQIRTIRDPD